MWFHGSMGDRRLFAAARPPAAQLLELEDFLDRIGIADAGMRLVSPAKWHITLSFMPAVHASQTESLHDALATLVRGTPPFSLVLRGAGLFARAGPSTPIWMGVEGDLPSLENLAAGCRTAAHRGGVRVDSPKHFRPHLTLARRQPPEHPALWMQRLDQFNGTPWTVQDIVLVDSMLGGRGTPARHRVVDRHALTG